MNEIDAPPIVSSFVRGEAPRLSREEIDGIYSAAVRFYARERWSEAGELFRWLVHARPEQARGWIGLAACHEGMGDDERALALYQLASTAAAPNANRKRARLYLARLLVKLGRHDEARAELDALERDACAGAEASDRSAEELRRCLMDTVPSMEAAP